MSRLPLCRVLHRPDQVTGGEQLTAGCVQFEAPFVRRSLILRMILVQKAGSCSGSCGFGTYEMRHQTSAIQGARAACVQLESSPARFCFAHPSRTALDDGCVLILRLIWVRKVGNFSGLCAVALTAAVLATGALAQNISPLELHPSLMTTQSQPTAPAPGSAPPAAPVRHLQPRRTEGPQTHVERRDDDKEFDDRLRICKGC
jgi:hypothetical protein